LLAAPGDDGDLAACVQHAEHQAHLAHAPPAMRSRPLGRWSSISRESSGPRRSSSRNTYRRNDAFLSGTRSDTGPLAGRADASALATAAGPRRARERVPLHELPLLPQQPIQLGAVRTARACSRGRAAGGATVEIGSTCRKPSRRTVSSTPRGRAVEELRADRDAARLVDAQLRRLHALRSIRSRRACEPARSAAFSSLPSTFAARLRLGGEPADAQHAVGAVGLAGRRGPGPVAGEERKHVVAVLRSCSRL